MVRKKEKTLDKIALDENQNYLRSSLTCEKSLSYRKGENMTENPCLIRHGYFSEDQSSREWCKHLLDRGYWF